MNDTLPNESLQATRDGVFSSAVAVHAFWSRVPELCRSAAGSIVAPTLVQQVYENETQHLGSDFSARDRPQPVLRHDVHRGRLQGASKRTGHGNPVEGGRPQRREG